MATPLLTCLQSAGHIHLVVGSNSLAGARCSKSLAAGAHPILLSPSAAPPHYTIDKLVEAGKIKWLQQNFQEEDLKTLGREEVDGFVDAVFVTSDPRGRQAAHISALCRRLRIPVNVSDAPNLCTFTLLSTYSDGPLHIGITTSGKGCKLASRIRREVVCALPPNLGRAIDRLGAMRRRIWEEDHRHYDGVAADGDGSANADADGDNAGPADDNNSDDDGPGQSASFNRLVFESDRAAAKTRRMRWLGQICEYWPLRRLAEISDADINAILRAYSLEQAESLSTAPPAKSGSNSRQKPRIVLAGSGPGSPHLLTMATHRALQTASYILADKLVPQSILDLIPRRTHVQIARKFPGNAEAAQQELLSLGLQALRSGEHATVLRLKQGDPYIYGRGGEELDFFRSAGFEVLVLPGITSALSAPLFARIPATHRGVADRVLICTGTGRRGAAVRMPDFDAGLTLVVLMGLHRLEALVETLVGRSTTMSESGAVSTDKQVTVRYEGRESTDGEQSSTTTTAAADAAAADGAAGPVAAMKDRGAAGVVSPMAPTKDRGAEVAGGHVAAPPAVPLAAPWPPATPCAVLERASCADQRVIRTTLAHVVEAVEREGSRPPGLLVVGAACEVLEQRQGARWLVEDGFRGLDELMAGPGGGALTSMGSGAGSESAAAAAAAAAPVAAAA